jgi:hypothetical protein
MSAIASILISKGLPILAGAILNRVIDKKGGKLFSKIKEKLGMKKAATETEVEAKLEQGLTQEEFNSLMELQYEIKLEEEVTKRLEIDNRADSWFTRHIRPLSLAFVTIATITFFFVAIFMEITTQQKADLVQVLGNYLFMLNSGIFGFYFGGRSWEKVKNIELDKVIERTREEIRQKNLNSAEVDEDDIPLI